jgi:uncharacterized circularly permuted ATP-grasp superfamily protein/uncharacterized alpha-E superfamily protein
MSEQRSVSLRYRPVGGYDEAVDADGRVRPAWQPLLAALDQDPGALRDRQRHLDRLLEAEGAGHLVHTEPGALDSRPWRLDPVPFVLDAVEHERLAAGVVQRIRVLEALVADAYGERRFVREGIVPGPVLFGCPGFQLGAAPPREPGRWIVSYAVDLVRLADGSWRVGRDLTDAPSGLGYTLIDRTVLARLLPDVYRAVGALAISDHAVRLRRALVAQAPAGRESPRTVVLTGGLGHPSYVEHSSLASLLGVHLVEGADLVVRAGRLWLRALGGLEQVDVVYRRLEDRGVDPLEVGAAGAKGVPALVRIARSCGVGLANAFGAGLAEDRHLWPYLDGVAHAVLGERLVLPGLATDGASLAPLPPLATVPVHRDGALEPATVVLRLHAVVGPDGVEVMPGGSARVVTDGRPLEAAHAELVKDVWVLGADRRPPALVAAPAMPQVDLRSSIPTRAADAMFFTGRAAERAEVAARTARTVAVQLDQDPGLVEVGDGAWALATISLLHAARGHPMPDPGVEPPGPSRPLIARLHAELGDTVAVAADRLGAMLHEASTVREFLSTTTARVLARLGRTRNDLLGPSPQVDDLDLVLVDLAAFSGLALDSTVRGPAWRFLELGRRLERALAVLGGVEAVLGADVPALALQPLAEALLGSNESLVAYRRRYRSDVERSAVLDLLVLDDTNPRGLAFQLDRLRDHTAALAWSHGSELVERASRALIGADDVSAVAGGRRLGVDRLVLEARGPLLELGDAVVARWFADPVNPAAMGQW